MLVAPGTVGDMVTAAEYVRVVHTQLHLAGAAMHQTTLGPVPVTVGEFDEQFGLVRIRHCVTVVAVDEASAPVMEDFQQRSTAYSKTLHVPRRGFDTRVLVFAAVVATRADHAAQVVATRGPRAGLSASSRSVLVDLSTGQVHLYVRSPFWSTHTEPRIRKTAEYLFPAPALVASLPHRSPGAV